MSSSKTDNITAILQSTTRRLRGQHGLHLLLMALSSGLGLTILLLLAGRQMPLAPLPWLGLAGVSTSGLLGLAALLYAALRPRSELTTARLIDQRAQLDDRLATTLELQYTPHTTPSQLITAQRQDTLRQLRQFEPRRHFPWQISRRWLGMLIILLLVVNLGLILPNPQETILAQQQQQAELLAEQVTQLEQIQAELLKNETLNTLPETELALEMLEKLIERLKQEELSAEEALATLSEAERTLSSLQHLAEESNTLNDMAEQFNQFESTKELAEAIEQRRMQEAGEKLKQAVEEAGQNPAQTQQLAEALRQAAETAAANGDQQLAEALRQAAEALEQSNGNSQAMQEALDQATQALQDSMGEMQPGNQQAVEQALGNIQRAREQLAQQKNQPKQLGQFSQQGEGRQGSAGREAPGEGAPGLTAEEGGPTEMETDNGANQGYERPYEQLYAPEHLGGEGGPIVKPEEQGAEGGVPIRDSEIDPNQADTNTQVPYNEIYPEYNRAANEALDGSYIPLGMKGYVREYFGALEPEGDN